jgi:hypothetical protein
VTTPPPEEFAASRPPVIATEPVDACPVCRCRGFEPRATGFDYELQTCANPWRFVTCHDCGHVWLNPRPAVAELPVIYPPHYYAYNYETVVHPIAARGKAYLDSKKMGGILRALPHVPHRYLDIGCGTGRYLRYMEQRRGRQTARR